MGRSGAIRRVALGLLILCAVAVNLAGTAPLSDAKAGVLTTAADESVFPEGLASEIGIVEGLGAANETATTTEAPVQTSTEAETTAAAETTKAPTTAAAQTTKQPTTAPPTQPPTTGPPTTKAPTPAATTKSPPAAVTTAAGGSTAAQGGSTPAAVVGTFNAASFVGGIVLGVAIVIITGFAYSFYKSRRDKNYQTL